MIRLMISISLTAILVSSPIREYPACLHTTVASLLSHPLSQIVPQASLMQISTLPMLSEGPSTNLMVPLLQTTGIEY